MLLLGHLLRMVGSAHFSTDAVAALGEPTQDPMYTRILSILDSKEKIPYIGRVLNGLYYNFWQARNPAPDLTCAH